MAEDGFKVRGTFRLQIVEDVDGVPVVKGDSGWHENQIVNLGFNQYLVSTLGAIEGSKQVTHVALGTGTAPGAAGTSLEGEVEARAAVTAATSSTSKTVRFTATFASADSFVSDTMTLKNIGLFNTADQTTGTLFAGNTFTTSTCATNQACNITYDITFS